jgi:hypothetical protein
VATTNESARSSDHAPAAILGGLFKAMNTLCETGDGGGRFATVSRDARGGTSVAMVTLVANQSQSLIPGSRRALGMGPGERSISTGEPP